MDSEQIIRSLIRAAVNAVSPEIFIPECFTLDQETLTIGDRNYRISAYDHVFIVSVGKAAAGMAAATDRIIHPYVSKGVVLTKHLPDTGFLSGHYRIYQGGHPVPTDESVAGAEAILSLLAEAGSNDLVIFLISGGGSSLMTAPAEGLSLETYRAFTSAVLRCGADINEFNILRKHLDRVKGGRLTQSAAPAQTVTVILSDVVGNPQEIIASGPTVPDSSTFGDALNILNKYETRAEFPPRIREILERGARGEIPETLKTGDPVFARSSAFIAADNRKAAYAAKAMGEFLGIPSRVVNTRLTGEASAVGRLLPSFFSELEAPGLLIFGGETTVTLNKGNGLGGRNLELALSAVRPMSEYPGCTLFTLATDGEDGPTDAAGAVVTADSLKRALDLGCSPESYLHDNDSYHFFEKTGDLLKPGPSGTNVNDLTFLLRMN